MTLRTRLTATLVAVTAAGLLVAGVATFSALRSSALGRVDDQLIASVVPAARLVAGDEEFGPPEGFPENPEVMPGTGVPIPPGPPDDESPILPPGAFGALYDETGAEVRHVSTGFGDVQPDVPELDAAEVSAALASGEPFTAEAIEGSTRFRVAARPLPGGWSIVLALPLTEVQATLTRLVLIEIVVSLAVLAAVALLARRTVGRGLRPLEEIETTAGAIAAGDLTQRIDDDDPRTEVGRLGASLNVMLGRIETAMDEQRASEEALRRFLADASHELRTPLTSIRGYAELFRRGAEDDPGDTALSMRRIEQESERMGILVDDLLFLARSGHDRPIVEESVDLSRIAADAVADARVVAPEREVTLDAPDRVVVTGDELRLRQVAANLLSNAIVHTPETAPVAVTVREDTDHVDLLVRDGGPGMSSEQAAQVFEPFYRADEARERVRPDRAGPAAGSGLGLAIVAAIADAHGGSVSLTTSPGEGATFTVRLPRSQTAH